MKVRCIKCDKKRGIVNAYITFTEKGIKMIHGNCVFCGTKVQQFISKDTQIEDFSNEEEFSNEED